VTLIRAAGKEPRLEVLAELRHFSASRQGGGCEYFGLLQAGYYLFTECVFQEGAWPSSAVEASPDRKFHRTAAGQVDNRGPSTLAHPNAFLSSKVE
jgi:hypothetical protein